VSTEQIVVAVVIAGLVLGLWVMSQTNPRGDN